MKPNVIFLHLIVNVMVCSLIMPWKNKFRMFFQIISPNGINPNNFLFALSIQIVAVIMFLWVFLMFLWF